MVFFIKHIKTITQNNLREFLLDKVAWASYLKNIQVAKKTFNILKAYVF